MRGFPKHLNTKQDYFNCLEKFPAETKAELNRLLTDRFVWVTIAVLDTDQEGMTDDTHRVVGEDDERLQQVLIENERAELFRRGFTVKETEELLND